MRGADHDGQGDAGLHGTGPGKLLIRDPLMLLLILFALLLLFLLLQHPVHRLLLIPWHDSAGHWSRTGSTPVWQTAKQDMIVVSKDASTDVSKQLLRLLCFQPVWQQVTLQLMHLITD